MLKKYFKIPKMYASVVNRRTDNGQKYEKTLTNKTLNRKLNVEQHEQTSKFTIPEALIPRTANSNIIT
jgi:hypothetical protein